jgi:hypothetical protein
MIDRHQEVERRIGQLEDEIAALRGALAAARQMMLQMAGGIPPMFGASSAFAVARASGAISALSGTTLGSGSVNFATHNATTLVEGTESVTVKNIHDLAIADNAWVIVGKTPKYWAVITPSSCGDLS